MEEDEEMAQDGEEEKDDAKYPDAFSDSEEEKEDTDNEQETIHINDA